MSSKLATDGTCLWRLWLADMVEIPEPRPVCMRYSNALQCKYATHCMIPTLYVQDKLIIWFCFRMDSLVVENLVLTPHLVVLITQYPPNKVR